MSYDYKPSVSELRKSLKRRAKEYFLENSLHGIPYIVDASRPKWERIVWSFLTIASAGAVIGIIMTIWDKFQTKPIMSGVDPMTDNLLIEFPQVFLCHDWSNLDHSILTDSEKGIYEQLYNWNWAETIDLEDSQIGFQRKNNFRGTFERLAPNCGDVFDNCTFGGESLLCGKALTTMITPAGICCRFNASRPLSLSDASRTFTFSPTSFPFRLYLLEQFDTVPLRERAIEEIYVPTTIEIRLYITYTTSDLKYLSLFQRQCHYENEAPSYNDCNLDCLTKGLLKQCGCLPWFLSPTEKSECLLSEYSCLSEIDTTPCACSLSCDYTSYNVDNIIEASYLNESSAVSIPSWPRSRFRRESRFGYLDLLVSFGGIAGLFLGYSLLTTIELGYYFSLRAYCGAVLHSSQKKHNIITVRVIDVKSPRKVHVKPIYYDYVN